MKVSFLLAKQKRYDDDTENGEAKTNKQTQKTKNKTRRTKAEW